MEYTALVFDTRTGDRILPPALFTDVDQAAVAVRAALGRHRAVRLDQRVRRPAFEGGGLDHPVAQGDRAQIDGIENIVHYLLLYGGVRSGGGGG